MTLVPRLTLISGGDSSGFQEKRSVGILVDYLKKHNFDVTVGVANLLTGRDPARLLFQALGERLAQVGFGLVEAAAYGVNVISLDAGQQVNDAFSVVFPRIGGAKWASSSLQPGSPCCGT